MKDMCLLQKVYGVELILESINKYYIISASGSESGIPNNTDYELPLGKLWNEVLFSVRKNCRAFP